MKKNPLNPKNNEHAVAYGIVKINIIHGNVRAIAADTHHHKYF
jgi:hypothetical protein